MSDQFKHLAPLSWLVGLVACSQATVTSAPPPVAGLWHPAAVRPGQALVLDARTTAVGAGTAADPGLAGTHIVNFRFEVATFAAVEQALPQLTWTFAQPGHYAIRLQVRDDLGRESAVVSAVDVVADLGDACTGTDAPACASGVCAAAQCAALVCAGPAACPKVLAGHALVCSQGACVPPAMATETDASVGGDDVGVVGSGDTSP